MGLIDELVRGGQGSNEVNDFIDRVTNATGGPETPSTTDAGAIPTEEAVQRHQQIAAKLPADQYRASAADAFSRLTPEERQQFAEWMKARAQQQGLDASLLGDTGRLQDPGALADATTNLQKQDPSIFEQLLGKGGTGGPLDNPIAKMAVAGIAAFAAQRLMGSRR